MSTSPSINLVRGRKPRVFDQFISWALSMGRAVVILTELVALGAFLYRFTLDRQLVDLHDKIAQEQSIVNLLKQNEDTYRNLQNRLQLAKTTVTGQQQTVKMYSDIVAMMSPDISLKTLIFDTNSVQMALNVPSVSALSVLIDNLKAYHGITNVSIDRIENRTSVGLISVTITATFTTAQKTGGKSS